MKSFFCLRLDLSACKKFLMMEIKKKTLCNLLTIIVYV